MPTVEPSAGAAVTPVELLTRLLEAEANLQATFSAQRALLRYISETSQALSQLLLLGEQTRGQYDNSSCSGGGSGDTHLRLAPSPATSPPLSLHALLMEEERCELLVSCQSHTAARKDGQGEREDEGDALRRLRHVRTLVYQRLIDFSGYPPSHAALYGSLQPYTLRRLLPFVESAVRFLVEQLLCTCRVSTCASEAVPKRADQRSTEGGVRRPCVEEASRARCFRVVCLTLHRVLQLLHLMMRSEPVGTEVNADTVEQQLTRCCVLYEPPFRATLRELVTRLQLSHRLLQEETAYDRLQSFGEKSSAGGCGSTTPVAANPTAVVEERQQEEEEGEGVMVSEGGAGADRLPSSVPSRSHGDADDEALAALLRAATARHQPPQMPPSCSAWCPGSEANYVELPSLGEIGTSHGLLPRWLTANEIDELASFSLHVCSLLSDVCTGSRER